MRIHNHHTGRRMTYGEMDEWRKARAAQQLATAGASDAEVLVTPPLDVAALPTPAQPTVTPPLDAAALPAPTVTPAPDWKADAERLAATGEAVWDDVCADVVLHCLYRIQIQEFRAALDAHRRLVEWPVAGTLPTQPTLEEWRELATRFAHMLECWHEFYQHGGALADCPTIACRAVHTYQELTERAGGEPCNGA